MDAKKGKTPRIHKADLAPIRKTASAGPCGIEIVVAKCTSSGWVVIRPPPGSVAHIYAQKGTKLYFIQVVTQPQPDLARNMFIQNAFSNGATPVYAHVSLRGVLFEDVNLNSRIIIK
jgi:hypothetical protein